MARFGLLVVKDDAGMARKGKLPWAKWYPEHLVTDAELGYCALSTRGAWYEWLNHMLIAGRTGRLVGTYEHLASLARCTAAAAKSAIDDLKERKPTGKSAADVTVRNGIVTLTNRRMRNEHKEREGTKIRVDRFREKRRCNGGEDRRQKTEDRNTPPLAPSGVTPKPDAGAGDFATVRSELESIGINGLGLRKALAIEGLTAAHVALLIRQKKNAPRIKDVPAVVCSVLGDPGYTPRTTLSAAEVESLGRRLVSIGGVQVNGHIPQRKYDDTTRRDFLYWFEMNGEHAETVRIDALDLKADTICLSRKQ